MEGSHVAADFNLPRVRVPQPGAKSLALAVGKHLTNVWVGAILLGSFQLLAISY